MLHIKEIHMIDSYDTIFLLYDWTSGWVERAHGTTKAYFGPTGDLKIE
jgi:hypothetical protein